MREFNNLFEQEVYEGLTAEKKRLSSKWFYDDRGRDIFQRILSLPEYYPSQCEHEIFRERDLASMLDMKSKDIDVLELGAGDGYKTALLLDKLQKQNKNVVYRPIDINSSTLDKLRMSIVKEQPSLDVQPLVGEYFEVLEEQKSQNDRPKVILLLGSSIGNLLHPAAIKFLSQLADNMTDHDKAIIGFDLQKDPDISLSAYNDEQGLTTDLNLNVLARINTELDANFDLSKFKHCPYYNPETGTCYSYLVSTAAQRVKIKALNLTLMLSQWETIQTEISQKYTHPVIHRLLTESGLAATDYVTDSKAWFAEYVIEKQNN